MDPQNWPAPNSYGFIAQLVEHCTGIAEVTGSNPAEAWIFFRLLFRNCLNCVSTAKIFHNVITHNRGTNPVTIMSKKSVGDFRLNLIFQFSSFSLKHVHLLKKLWVPHKNLLSINISFSYTYIKLFKVYTHINQLHSLRLLISIVLQYSWFGPLWLELKLFSSSSVPQSLSFCCLLYSFFFCTSFRQSCRLQVNWFCSVEAREYLSVCLAPT